MKNLLKKIKINNCLKRFVGNYRTLDKKKWNPTWLYFGSGVLMSGFLIENAKSDSSLWSKSDYLRVSDNTRTAIIKSALLYPKTIDSNPVLRISKTVLCEEDYDEIIRNVESDILLAKSDFVEDLLYILNVLKIIHKDALLYKVDTIKIKYKGLSILDIVNNNNECGRSVHINIEEIRSKIQFDLR